ncbi:MAG: helix-turn-helix domain-containing protein [Blautia sp.]|nr:helix-turn-helix domain-containing protein [Blautia sp.]
MNNKQQIGYEIHTLDKMLGRVVCASQSGIPQNQGLTQMQGWIIHYIYTNPDKDIFQKDIEAYFHIASSTATGILKLMEKNGFLIRKAHPLDARMKILTLTDKSIALQLAIIENFTKIEAMLRQDIPPEMLQVFFDVIHQIKNNIKQNEQILTEK